MFDSSCLPPEMFMKVDSLELSLYNQYWRSVMELEKVKIPADLIKPRIDPVTNETYVMKCYCSLDEKSAELLPPLPYELVELDKSVDVWSFGVFLFTLVSGGETIFQPNFRTGKLTSIEMVANWNNDVAEAIITQYVEDLAAQDLLLHILVAGEQRKQIDMDTILAHPFFSTSSLPERVTKILAEARDERELIGKVRRRQRENQKNVDAMERETTRLGRLGLRTQLRLTNSATEALKEAFDPKGTFKNAPFTHMLLPYKLIANNEGRLVPGTKMDMELAQRLGRQLLELCKAVGFAACYSETLTTRSQMFQKYISSLFLTRDVDPSRASQEILATFHLDGTHYNDLAMKFVMIVQAQLEKDSKSFIKDPMAPVLSLVSQYASSVADTFSVPNRAFLYLVDEFSSVVALQKDGGGQYPHVFRDHLSDIVYKALPYMHACVTSALCAEDGVAGLLKLLAEGAYPDVPESWALLAKGIPTLPIRKRMVTEVKILHRVSHSLIASQSPVALNGETEMQFLSSLYLHIDSNRSYGGLRPATDESGTMWVTEESKLQLLEETSEESKPERVYEIYAREEAEMNKMQENESKIAQLEKALRKTTKEVERLKYKSI